MERVFFHYDFKKNTQRSVPPHYIKDLLTHPSRSRVSTERKRLIYALNNNPENPKTLLKHIQKPGETNNNVLRRGGLFEIIIPEDVAAEMREDSSLERRKSRKKKKKKRKKKKSKLKSCKRKNKEKEETTETSIPYNDESDGPKSEQEFSLDFLELKSEDELLDDDIRLPEISNNFHAGDEKSTRHQEKKSTPRAITADDYSTTNSTRLFLERVFFHYDFKKNTQRSVPPHYIKDLLTHPSRSRVSTERKRLIYALNNNPENPKTLLKHIQKPGETNNNVLRRGGLFEIIIPEDVAAEKIDAAATETLPKKNENPKSKAFYSTQTLFRERTEGYRMFRIPTIVTTKSGTVLVFCEGRRHAVHDHGSIDIVYRRSNDSGRTWEPMRVLINGRGEALSNPSPVVDGKQGVVVLVFCRSKSWATEPMIRIGEASHRTVWVTRSLDDGRTWFKPKEITRSVRLEDWSWYATGPVHGIQLKSGRLVVPCNHVVGFKRTGGWKDRSHVIYSDDSGLTWQIGGSSRFGTNEATIVQVSNGSLYLNSRNMLLKKHRIAAWSDDNGETFHDGKLESTLIEPDGHGCQGSLLPLTVNRKKVILFANPSTKQRKRENVSISISFDDCDSWEFARTIYAGSSAYTDMVALKNGIVGLIYERGFNHPYQSIAFDQFNLDWLFEMRIANKLI
ncbi:unnamed protein product [Notodromas monacha]|uniref:Sialidase domain-containing protein n=1 Tax=Notodromas monacha TaxID=399045 RepID=A0A7R9BQM6_9CRUS|nr:unnamed protein product [Notodromas monacha]CAG0918797.1 unnamed protein product [Notodromas monacha]